MKPIELRQRVTLSPDYVNWYTGLYPLTSRYSDVVPGDYTVWRVNKERDEYTLFRPGAILLNVPREFIIVERNA
jgi:phage anti-repressor protein